MGTRVDAADIVSSHFIFLLNNGGKNGKKIKNENKEKVFKSF